MATEQIQKSSLPFVGCLRGFFRFAHHRSLSASILCLFCALLALSFLIENRYRIDHLGSAYLLPASVVASVGVVTAGLTLILLIHDNRSGYPAMRCSLATFLWALSCVPNGLLALVVVGELVR